MQRHGEQAKLIISMALNLLGLEDSQFVAAVRVDGSVTVVGLDTEADKVLDQSAGKIWEVTAKAGHPFNLDHAHGFPILTNRHG